MLKGILAISGQPGLYKMISEGKNSVIVESLLTGKKSTAYASAKMSTLEDIAIYTVNEDVPLKEVFKKMAEKENGGTAINVKASNDTLKDYFETILPQFDKDRVYASDIKKVINCYNLLQEKVLLNFEEEQVAQEAEEKPAAQE